MATMGRQPPSGPEKSSGRSTLVSRPVRCALVLLVLLASVETAFAPPAEGQLLLGVRVGGGSSALTGDRPENATYTGRTAFSIRGLVGAGIADGLFLTVEPGVGGGGTGVAYVVRGQDEPRDSIDVSLQYVSMPLGLRVGTGGGRFYATSALNLAYLVSAEIDDGSGPTDVLDSVNRFDVGVGFAVGTRIGLGRPRLTVELRYTQSVRNLTDDNYVPPGWDFAPRFKSRGFGIIGGLEFEVGGPR
jgi:hypothetical protein